jgi:hypothetical protein
MTRQRKLNLILLPQELDRETDVDVLVVEVRTKCLCKFLLDSKCCRRCLSDHHVDLRLGSNHPIIDLNKIIFLWRYSPLATMTTTPSRSRLPVRSASPVLMSNIVTLYELASLWRLLPIVWS